MEAFSNYIEGEIRFDVLDDDRFEDISTSSREGYKKDDPRIEKLLEIVGKIVTRLMSVRINARDDLNKLVEIYNEEQQQKKEAEKKLLEEQLQESQRQVSSAIAEKERVEIEIKKERKRIDYIIGVSNVNDSLFVLYACRHIFCFRRFGSNRTYCAQSRFSRIVHYQWNGAYARSFSY